MNTQEQPRFEVRLKSARALRRAMEYRRLNVRQLATACGNPKHRSTIGAMHSEGPAHRNYCSPALAARIEEVLDLPSGSLFNVRVSNPNMEITAQTRKAA